MPGRRDITTVDFPVAQPSSLCMPTVIFVAWLKFGPSNAIVAIGQPRGPFRAFLRRRLRRRSSVDIARSDVAICCCRDSEKFLCRHFDLFLWLVQFLQPPAMSLN